MNALTNISIKRYLMVGSLALLFVWADSAFSASATKAKKIISITVGVNKYIAEKMHVFGVGFSVNDKNRGSMGNSTTKTGPANAKYSFGFRSYRTNISCGSAVLTQDSHVILYFKGSTCTNKVFPKNH